MIRDWEILTSLLVEAEKCGCRIEDDPAKVYHIALLKDMGLVEAKIDCDETGELKAAKIVRITNDGYNALCEMRNSGSARITQPSREHLVRIVEDEKSKAKYEFQKDIKDEFKSFEHVIYGVSSAGMVLAIGIFRFAFECDKLAGWYIWLPTSIFFAFGITILTQVICSRMAIKAKREAIRQLHFNQSSSNALVLDKVVEILNKCIAWIFRFGLILTLICILSVIINIPKFKEGKAMDDKKQTMIKNASATFTPLEQDVLMPKPADSNNGGNGSSEK